MQWKRGYAAAAGIVGGLVFTGLNLAIANAAHKGPATEYVVRATRAIAPGQPIQIGDVAVVAVPTSQVPPGTITNAAAVVGHIAGHGIAQGQFLTAAALQSGPAASVPAGKVLVGVPVGLVRSSGQLAPGDRVDVLVDIAQNATAGAASAVSTHVVATGVQVLSVASSDGQPVTSAPASNTGSLVSATQSSIPAVATLLVSPSQALAIVQADRAGVVFLVVDPHGALAGAAAPANPRVAGPPPVPGTPTAGH